MLKVRYILFIIIILIPIIVLCEDIESFGRITESGTVSTDYDYFVADSINMQIDCGTTQQSESYEFGSPLLLLDDTETTPNVGIESWKLYQN